MATEEGEIDDSLYSRQIYVLGESAMKKMACSDVILIGVGGLGIEIAKNIVLAGVRSLTIHDESKATMGDLGTQFFLREDDVIANKTRAEASVPRLAELNPYVNVKSSQQEVSMDSNLEFLKEYNCVIVTGAPLDLLLQMDKFCRSQQPGIKFIMSDVYGLHSYVFCDFGDEFTIVDHDGEEPKQFVISSISKETNGFVTGFDGNIHGFEDNDYVTFKEIEGMTALNGCQRQIAVESPYAFTIGDLTGDEFQPYVTGGIATQVKMPRTARFASLTEELKCPSVDVVDYTKDPHVSHLAIHALLQFKAKNRRLPQVWSEVDAEHLINIAIQFNQELYNPLENLDTDIIRKLGYTARGCFVPLTAAMGGIVAQEVLKALSGKFTPLHQWMFIDASELMNSQTMMPGKDVLARGDRYESLRICLGDEILQRLANLRLFLVGCGAIGCELMKNFSLLGVGSAGTGSITITDDDLIEKSNLNRQFLFRSHHIQKPKSETAAFAAKEINQALRIESYQKRVCRDTELTHFSDNFFRQTDVAVNALDNIPARIYMDRRCVMNKTPLIDSGTMGTIGHVQVIIPDITETYSSQDDSATTEIPHCTLKSFPSTIEHTIQWARDKFESLFNEKPTMFNKFWSNNDAPQKALEKLESRSQPENTMQMLKLMQNRPQSWKECVAIARMEFETYFNHKAKDLLHAFPADSKTKQGDTFWKSPRRIPSPVEFDSNDILHMLFIMSTARLYAKLCNLTLTDVDTSTEMLLAILEHVQVPSFVPTNKTVATDKSVTKDDVKRKKTDANITDCIDTMQELTVSGRTQETFMKMTPIEFEKDDDTNGHIDFITSTSNLRAHMYGIEKADRYKTKRIAGRIIPAIATTTATVSGLVVLELIRHLKGARREEYHNCFLNLGKALVEFSEPGMPVITEIIPGMSFTQWDMWRVNGNPDFTLHDFIQYFQDKYNLSVSVVLQGNEMVYEPIIPKYGNILLPNKLAYLLKQTDDIPYVELSVAFKSEKGEDVQGPPIRYYFNI